MCLIDKSANENDMASDMEEAFRERAIEVVRSHQTQQSHPDFDGVHCIDCDDGLPEVRLTMGRIRCVHCQVILERKQRGLHAET